MAKWTVRQRTQRFAGPGPGGRDVSHGVNVYLLDESGAERKIAVWYAPQVREVDNQPKRVVVPYLDDDDPPQHFLVSEADVSMIDAD
jgi:hypothetical protein